MAINLKEKFPARPVTRLADEKHVRDLCARFIWKNGERSVFLCPKAAGKGAIFTTREEALKERPDLAGKIQEPEENHETWDEIVLFIPRRMCQKREFLLDAELSDPDLGAQLKAFIFIEDDASAVVTLNLHSRGADAKNTCKLAVVCCVGKNARLVLNEVQDFGPNTVCVRREQTAVDEGGDLRWNVCELGCSESRDDLAVRLCGENASAVVYGLYFPTGHQQMIMKTRQDHLVPHTFSDLHYKGAPAGHAEASWEGMVYVDPKAGKADGYQKNETLLLSDEAKIFAKPGLEIITDDVKCSHGTTITSIDEEQIFYLTSRGLPEKEAEQLVVRGFFDTILNRITYSPIRGKLQEKIGLKMQEGES